MRVQTGFELGLICAERLKQTHRHKDYMTDMDVLVQTQQKATIMKGLEHLTHKERLGKLSLRKVHVDLIRVHGKE